MTEPNRSAKEEALKIIGEMGDAASLRDILFAIHHQSTLNDTISYQKTFRDLQQTSPKRTLLSKSADMLGCLLPMIGIIAVFSLMPLLFSLGERITGQRPPRVLREGKILAIELISGSDPSRYVGKHCRVLEYQLEVDAESSSIIIPNEHFRSVQVQRDR